MSHLPSESSPNPFRTVQEEREIQGYEPARSWCTRGCGAVRLECHLHSVCSRALVDISLTKPDRQRYAGDRPDSIVWRRLSTCRIKLDFLDGEEHGHWILPMPKGLRYSIPFQLVFAGISSSITLICYALELS